MEKYEKNREITGSYDRALSAECINGTFVGLEKEGVTVFKGIPFAMPPTERLRWREPVPVIPRKGVFEAYHNAKSAIQSCIDSEVASSYEQGEDCLYLNVWTASDFKEKKRPVMVFIHGGNYGWGGTVDPLYDGHNFVKASPDIVMVTIAYRLGIMGFVDFSRVPGGEAYPKSGNLGLLDQICALRYIQSNISAFGGDCENVTVFGESAGGGSVSLLPMIPEAKGLFKRVIAQSGSVALTFSREECFAFTKKLLKKTGAKTMNDLLALTEEEIIEANEELNTSNNFPERDGIILPAEPYSTYESGEDFDVDMLIGTNQDEVRYWIHEVGGVRKYRYLIGVKFENDMKQVSAKDRDSVKKFIDSLGEKKPWNWPWHLTEYFNEIMFRLPAIRQAQAHADHGKNTWMYYWKYPSSLPYMKACHAVELAYVFNNTQETIYTGEGVNKELADKASAMWAAFARTGDPSIEGVSWEKYDTDSRKTMVIDSELYMESDIKKEQRRILFPVLNYYFNGNYADLSPGVPIVYKTLAVAGGAVLAAAGLISLLMRRIRKR